MLVGQSAVEVDQEVVPERDRGVDPRTNLLDEDAVNLSVAAAVEVEALPNYIHLYDEIYSFLIDPQYGVVRLMFFVYCVHILYFMSGFCFPLHFLGQCAKKIQLS